MSSSVCNFIISELLFDLFVGTFLMPFRFLFLIGNVVAETPHRTEVRFQNEENAPVVPPNKKFLFTKMKAASLELACGQSNTAQLMTIQTGCDNSTLSFLGYLYTS